MADAPEDPTPDSASPHQESPSHLPATRDHDYSTSEPEEDDGGPVKPFLEHLEDLRWVLIKAGAALLVSMSLCMAGAPYLIKVLTRPMDQAGITTTLNPMGPAGGFAVAMKVAFFGGITCALPFILFYVAQFILPALKPHEKKYFIRAFAVGAGLFMAGVAMCYFLMLGLALRGMVELNKWLGFTSDIWQAEQYFHFILLFMVGTGVSMELPVVLLTLVKMGIVPHEWLLKSRKYFFLGNYVLCAFVTPDFVSTFFMVIPVQILLEICVLISKHWERQKKKAEAAQA